MVNGMTRPNLPPWMTAMREAAMTAIKVEDIQKIVQNQVEKAKAGDPHAIKFVFDLALGAPPKGATFVQNVTHVSADDLEPEEPTRSRPGSRRKVKVLQNRYANGAPLFNGDDGPGDDDDDDE